MNQAQFAMRLGKPVMTDAQRLQEKEERLGKAAVSLTQTAQVSLNTAFRILEAIKAGEVEHVKGEF